MTLISAPLNRADRVGSPPGGLTIRAMQVGQHVIAAALTAVGVVRATASGTPVTIAVISGLAVLVWHTAGALIPALPGSRVFTSGWLLGFAAVWIAAVTVSAEFVWLAFLMWLLAGHLLPIPWGLLFSGGVLAVVVVAPVLHHGTTSYANIFGPLIGGVFAYGISRGYLQLLKDADERERLVASLTRAQQDTAALQDELALAQYESGAMAERTRIARDIHDTVAQDLSSIRLLAHAAAQSAEGLLAKEPTSFDAAHTTLTQIETVAGESLADVRRIVAALVPAELEHSALAVALRRMLDRLHAETGIAVELHVDDSLPLLPTPIEVALLRTAQSALSNVRIHANATRAVMSLIAAGKVVRLDLIDDGTGFDVSLWERSASRSDDTTASFGLRFIRARLRELGGDLIVESSPGEGTAISIQLPVGGTHAAPATEEARS